MPYFIYFTNEETNVKIPYHYCLTNSLRPKEVAYSCNLATLSEYTLKGNFCESKLSWSYSYQQSLILHKDSKISFPNNIFIKDNTIGS